MLGRAVAERGVCLVRQKRQLRGEDSYVHKHGTGSERGKTAWTSDIMSHTYSDRMPSTSWNRFTYVDLGMNRLERCRRTLPDKIEQLDRKES